MNWPLLAGLATTILGAAGYVAGVFVQYPARAFSLTLLMFGTTLVLISRPGVADSV